MQLTSTISTSIDKLKRRLIKVTRFGRDDVQEPFQASEYGIDSNPIKGMVAVYSTTGENGKNVIIGYINKNLKAGPGELRTFATDENGNEKFYTWMRSSGIIEIGGDANYAVKFNELKTEYNSLKSDHNTLVQKWNAFCASYIPGGPTVVGSPATLSTSTVTPNSSNIDNAKNDKIKTI
jgi:hypothetical protein